MPPFATRCLRRAMTLVRPWRLPLGEDSLTQLLETLRERYRRRTFLVKLHHNPSLVEIFTQLQAIINAIQ